MEIVNLKRSAKVRAFIKNMHNRIVKQAKNRLLGNLYLHLISELFFRFLQEKQLLNFLDGEFSADNYDGIVVFSFSNPALNLEEIINHFKIQSIDIIRAINRISCDKQRKASFDLKVVTQEAIELHQKPWLNSHITAPIDPSACTLKTETLSLSRRSNKSFSELDVFLESNISENCLKPLISIVLNSLSEVLESYIYTHPDFPSYISQQQWSDYHLNPNYIGLKSQIRFPKNTRPQPKILLQYLKNLLPKIQQLQFTEKLYTKIQKEQLSLSDNEILTSSGFLVTADYWQQSSLQDVESIFSQIDLSI